MKLFNQRIKKEDKTVKINPKYPNFRLHYMDIRNTIVLFEKIFYFYERFNNKNILHKDMANEFNELIYNCKILQKNLSTKKNKFIDKILNRYNHIEIKEKINILYKELILDTLENIINMSIDIRDQCTRSTENTQKKLNNDIDFLFKTIINFFCCLTDLYFLRRFLDKNYINNSILYTGLLHMVDITYILVKYFDFKITNTYYIDKKFKLDKIKSMKLLNLDYMNKLSDVMTQTYGKGKMAPLFQCVNLLDFPPNFT
jgi:hypothetical protein